MTLKPWNLRGVLELVPVGTGESKLLVREWLRKKLMPSLIPSEDVTGERPVPKLVRADFVKQEKVFATAA